MWRYPFRSHYSRHAFTVLPLTKMAVPKRGAKRRSGLSPCPTRRMELIESTLKAGRRCGGGANHEFRGLGWKSTHVRPRFSSSSIRGFGTLALPLVASWVLPLVRLCPRSPFRSATTNVSDNYGGKNVPICTHPVAGVIITLTPFTSPGPAFLVLV